MNFKEWMHSDPSLRVCSTTLNGGSSRLELTAREIYSCSKTCPFRTSSPWCSGRQQEHLQQSQYHKHFEADEAQQQRWNRRRCWSNKHCNRRTSSSSRSNNNNSIKNRNITSSSLKFLCRQKKQEEQEHRSCSRNTTAAAAAAAGERASQGMTMLWTFIFNSASWEMVTFSTIIHFPLHPSSPTRVLWPLYSPESYVQD